MYTLVLFDSPYLHNSHYKKFPITCFWPILGWLKGLKSCNKKSPCLISFRSTNQQMGPFQKPLGHFAAVIQALEANRHNWISVFKGIFLSQTLRGRHLSHVTAEHQISNCEVEVNLAGHWIAGLSAQKSRTSILPSSISNHFQSVSGFHKQSASF